MTAGILETIPEIACGQENISPTPEAAPTYGALIDNGAEILYPGLMLKRKESLSSLVRLLEKSNVLLPEQRLAFRTGASGSDLVAYPTNLYTAEAFLDLREENIARGLFELIYSSSGS